ncbi:MAG TPA: inorganic phosphate transporter [Candidatus Rikenella faecigallinarum]|uniref:Phosphate transporter n=1 Tax=Candidatus Rikenella faecigallinarum TaxID=2838745 RepID=A0A9D1QC56_9BACT|nr:inorganic phosphate transporter [Candidatus Rikenella faecigallinarum]
MDNIYLVVVAILMALAVSDLIVGVSNDAVNFLNSALGSKAAPRYVILLVASAGILLGSIFSSGMMEVARRGVFYPENFYFHEMMMIFLAVMFTDVILLDLFNTFGLPTSTTVSLVFELLGSAVAVALVKIWSAGGSMAELPIYINSGKALGIISGILTSVVIAFVTGTVVMYITRVIFSFHYQKSFRYIGPLWCGIALTAISYFAIFKGLKDTSLMPHEAMEWMNQHTFLLLVYCFIGWTILMGLIQYLLRWNILRITVLAGTLSLALAFAGNDLVNFIGVFVAGYDSYNIASAAAASGVDISTLKMSGLAGAVPANPLILFIGGAIMVITIWLSKKARSVSDTEINLARQDDGVERFGSTSLSRAIVRGAVNFNKKFVKYVPERAQRFIERRFEPLTVAETEEKAPFDLIRATVNLSVASILIASATSLRLPLSTTYVTFMVAMGSSLADRAWGRESAVYRITGVLTVISGWFLTAAVAFTVAFVVGMILMYGGNIAIFVLAVVCAFILFQSKVLFSRRQKKEAAREAFYKAEDKELNIIDESTQEICNAMQTMTKLYSDTLEGLANEDRRKLKDTMRAAEQMYQEAHERKYRLLPILRKLEANNIDTGHYYVQVADYVNEVAKALVHITRPSFEHIDNNHEGLSAEQLADLQEINKRVSAIYDEIIRMLQTKDFSKLDETLMHRDLLFEALAKAIKNQIYRVRDNASSSRSSMLYLEIINETKTMVLQSRNLLKAQKHFLSTEEYL